MRSWKILHGESSQGWGGQERRVLLEMLAMRKRGSDVHLVCHAQSGLAARAKQEGFVVHAVAMRRWYAPATLLRLLLLLRRERYDLVHTHSSADSWALGVAAQALGAHRPRVVRTRHLSTPARGTAVYTRLTDRIITTGTTIRSHLISRGVPAEKIVSIPTGVDLSKYRDEPSWREEFRREIHAQQDDAVIGNVAVLRSWKGHDDFLEVAKRVHARVPKSRFVIVGDGPQRRRLARRIEVEGLDFVHMAGHREDVPRALSGMDIFLFTSYANEGVPQAVAQAMAVGRPVAATRSGSIQDLIPDGDAGVLCEARDVEGIAKGVMDLLKDSARGEKMRRQARDRVECLFSLEKMEESLLGVYREVLWPGAPATTKSPWKVAIVRQKISAHGGAEGVVQRIAQAFARQGHWVHVLAGEWEDTIPRVAYHRIPIASKISWLKSLRFQKGVSDFLRRRRFDVVLGFDRAYPANVYRAGDGCHRTWMRYAQADKPWIWLDPKNWILLALERRLLSHDALKVVIANSEMVREDLLRDSPVEPCKIRVVKNGVELSECRPPSASERAKEKVTLGLKAGETVLLFLGSNYHRKGLRHAIAAVAQNKEHPVHLVVAGKGDEKPYRRLASKLGVSDKVSFLGQVRDPRPLYRAADLFVLPTLYDPFSNVCLEAMAHGVPVLTTNRNGAAEVLREGSGWVVAPEETSWALNVALRADLWSMGRQALDDARAHGFDRMFQALQDSLSDVAKAR